MTDTPDQPTNLSEVTVDHAPGYIIGIQREKYSWSYLVVEGESPNNDSGEDWHPESELSE